MAAPAGTVGVLGAPAKATVDEHGTVHLGGVTLGWLVGAEDRWHDPRDDAGVRRHRLAPAPAYETRVRIPSGDAVQRVYGARARDGSPWVVVDVENASPAPFAIAFVLRSAAPQRCQVALDAARAPVLVWFDDRAVLALARPPMRWALADAATGTAATVTGGTAREGPFEGAQVARPEVALVHPVTHRTTIRVALPLAAGTGAGADVPLQLPDVEGICRGWVSQLERGMRVELPGRLGERIDGARASLLVEAGVASPPADTIANLEDWGFDDEAAGAWERASLRERRRAARRGAPAARPALANLPDAEALRRARDTVIADHRRTIDLLPGFDPEWVGQPVTVHDAPTRAGLVSFAVRWHGERPAVLWDAPEGVTLRAPVLDPGWSVAGGRGETLLRAWPRPAANGDAFS
jgi:hypothetical protein